MKKLFLYITLALLPLIGTLSPQTRLKRFNELSFLVAHNAYANKKDGWFYRQQDLSLQEQLDYGVRGFMLATHSTHDEIKMCHGKCFGLYGLQRGLKAGLKTLFGYDPGYQTLHNALETIGSWMCCPQNKHEIVTLFLENYIDDDKLEQILLKHPTTAKLIFGPQDKKTSSWPTIQEMITTNKRLVVFNEKKQGTKISSSQCSTFFHLWDHVIESSYGHTHPHKVCRERKESNNAPVSKEERHLFLLNYFSYPSLPSYARTNNTFEKIIHTIKTCDKNPHLCPNKKPNFIALDFVHIGDGLKVVHMLNEERYDKN